MTLHLIPHNTSASVDTCLDIAGENDALLFLQDGVYALVTRNIPRACAARIYVLAEDLRHRGLTSRCPVEAEPIEFETFVELTEKHTPSVTWR